MDTSSEAWRHECEARELLTWPLSKRRDFLHGYKDMDGKNHKGVLGNRGQAAVDALKATLYRLWVEQQVDQLMKLPRDDQRVARLLRLEEGTNRSMRNAVETALKGRLAANDNQGE